MREGGELGMSGKAVPMGKMGTHQGTALGSWADLTREGGACGQRMEGRSNKGLFLCFVLRWNLSV